MTTIAAAWADGKGVMVADRRITIGDLYFPSTKIVRIKAEIVGTAGSDGEGQDFFEWFRKQIDARPKLSEDDFAALVLRKDGLHYFDYTATGTRIELPFFAIGSGALGALVAMEKGATPEEAIHLVAKFSHGTGFETDQLELT